MSTNNSMLTILEHPELGAVRLTALQDKGVIIALRGKDLTFETYGFEDEVMMMRKYGSLMFEHMAKGFHLVEQDEFWLYKWLDVRFISEPSTASILFPNCDESKYWFGAKKPFLFDGWLYVNPFDENGYTVLRFMKANLSKRLTTQLHALDKLISTGINISYGNCECERFDLKQLISLDDIEPESLERSTLDFLNLIGVNIKMPRIFAIQPLPHFSGF